MSVLAKLEPRDQSGNRRSAARRKLTLGSMLATSGAEVVIHDLSVTGLLIETSGELGTGETLLIDIPERGPTAATVMWNSGRFFGCAFGRRIPLAAVSAALLRNPVAPRQQLAAGENAWAPDPSLFAVADDAEEIDRYSLRTRMLVMLGMAVAAWMLVAGMVAWAI